MVDLVKRILVDFGMKNNVTIGTVSGKQKKTYHQSVPFVAYKPIERSNPGLYMKEANSIIVMLMPLQYIAPKPQSMVGRGVLSTDGVGMDYHLLLQNKLNLLWKSIIENKALSHHQGAIFVDRGPLIERELAREANMGVYGKSGQIISPIWGAYSYIGYIITDISFFQMEQEEFKEDICENCSLCVEACPGGALDDRFDYSRCASFITQKKEDLTIYEEKILGNQLYGCDVCRDICPYNLKLGIHVESDCMYPSVEGFLGLSNREFQEKYKNRGFTWRGRRVIERNIETILKNQKREKLI